MAFVGQLLHSFDPVWKRASFSNPPDVLASGLHSGRLRIVHPVQIFMQASKSMTNGYSGFSINHALRSSIAQTNPQFKTSKNIFSIKSTTYRQLPTSAPLTGSYSCRRKGDLRLPQFNFYDYSQLNSKTTPHRRCQNALLPVSEPPSFHPTRRHICALAQRGFFSSSFPLYL